MSDKIQMRFWNVYLSVEVEEPFAASRYKDADGVLIERPAGTRMVKRNKTLGVAAPSLGAAAQAALDAFPGADLWTIQHRGEITHSVNPIDYGLMGHHEHDKPLPAQATTFG